MLVLRNLYVKHGANSVLNHINLEIQQGELVVLLGANGAGKSTLFQTISGLKRPDSGDIQFLDKAIHRLSASQIVKEGVVQCAEGRMLFPQMSVHENLKMGAYTYKRNKAEMSRQLDKIYDLFPDLIAKRQALAGSLSGGQQQMVAIGRALMAKPKLLMLDEPSLGLAPLIVKQMFSVIQEINQTGVTVLLAEQNAHAALSISSRGYVLENGSLVLEGTKEALLDNDEIRKAYIGA
ncbi:ABC transporter ATP-binding protein [Halalkalibacter akibai]|uniref:Branched-chain amino acid transport ATP-binding protein LivF n=1 Tax=Halalkalibacter akibai (strain ATCC 43226 / DSM 21942 / CIP 109018 / JCM 9157 / 1139) TaxID=1236973 RepID=W4QNZ9_HALA3|nr:ABC transporter ATP-binding protein [Halalkalibacter akibai]GAE33388.1 branched-chain amino acid transport ATP-binding protein LivF [Halalkalibacter akibai JCM 9157]